MKEGAASSSVPAQRSMSTWLWLLLIVIGLALLIVTPIAAWLFQQELAPFSIVIDGTEHVYSVHLGGLSEGHRALIVIGLFAVVVAVLVAIPIVVATLLAIACIGFVLSIGLPVVMTAALVLAFLSPLLLLVFLARRVWRGAGKRAPAPAQTFGPTISA
jgi:hypothetical protein